MKKKVLAAFLLAGALAVVPFGGAGKPIMASASSNNTVSGTSGSGGSDFFRPSSAAQAVVEDRIANANSGDVIRVEGVTTLSNGDMKLLLQKGDVTLVLEYTYEGVEYVVTIPAGAAVDNDIPWYGPLYLASVYGNGVVRTGGASYTVQAGDSLSRIAQANGMTVAELAAKNPQISDVDYIVVGQQINLR